MDLGLAGRGGLVLGSSDGLGKAVAAALAEEGADVVVTGRDREKLEETARTIGAVASIAADLTEDGEPERVVEEAVGLLGRLDLLVVNTGGGRPGGILDTDAGDTDRAYRAMLRPALAAARSGAGPLRASGDGRLVFMTARSILEATPDLALSSVFRSGVAAAARSLALELAPHVSVNVVVPGQFDTGAYRRFTEWEADRHDEGVEQVRRRHVEVIPKGRLGEVNELAAAVVFLCSSAAAFVTGSVLRVDGGAVRGF